MNAHKIYRPEAVVAVQQLHFEFIERRLSYPSVLIELENYSVNLFRNYRVKNPAVIVEISNHHPELAGASPEFIFNAEMDMEDIQFTIARAYGFEDWEMVKALGNAKHNPHFEMAIDILLTGNIETLEDHLTQYPHLIHQRSAYGHQAGLIHYLSANGVEIWRQIVPDNLEGLLRFLVRSGADPDMMAKLYGENNLLALLTSSDHVWKAGVARKTIRRLESRVF